MFSSHVSKQPIMKSLRRALCGSFPLLAFLFFCIESPLSLVWGFDQKFHGGQSTRHAAGTASRRASSVPTTENLSELRKRELLNILKDYNVEGSGLTKQELIQKIQELRCEEPISISISQREIAEIAMEDWQNATTVGFDCRAGHRSTDGVDFDIVGPTGHYTVSFQRQSWPPRCTCANAQQWGRQRRCKHVCMILVKCGVPYAAVANSKWQPDQAEVESIVEHMLGPWTPIPLSQDS